GTQASDANLISPAQVRIGFIPFPITCSFPAAISPIPRPRLTSGDNPNNESTTSGESHPRSEAQKEASRENGKHSHGPTSDQGKARSSQNSTTHGLRSSRIVLINESQAKYDNLLARYRDIYKPIGQIEYDSLVQMVNAQWRIRRIQEMETGIIDGEAQRHQPSGRNLSATMRLSFVSSAL